MSAKKYAEYYSEYGLKKMIEVYTKDIENKKKEYNEVEERYNPLCADGWRREIKEQINDLNNTIEELKYALKLKQEVNKL
jgi:hypothetical protein